MPIGPTSSSRAWSDVTGSKSRPSSHERRSADHRRVLDAAAREIADIIVGADASPAARAMDIGHDRWSSIMVDHVEAVEVPILRVHRRLRDLAVPFGHAVRIVGAAPPWLPIHDRGLPIPCDGAGVAAKLAALLCERGVPASAVTAVGGPMDRHRRKIDDLIEIVSGVPPTGPPVAEPPSEPDPPGLRRIPVDAAVLERRLAARSAQAAGMLDRWAVRRGHRETARVAMTRIITGSIVT